MANFKYDTLDEKKRLKERALAIKPRVHNVVATARGWAVPQPNGTLELLVSFAGLDDLLGDVTLDIPEVDEATFFPVTSIQDTTEDPKEEVKVEEPKPVETPKKKGGRPAAKKD